MISSNNKHSQQRIRFRPHQILKIQQEVEKYRQEKYPHLEDKTLYQDIKEKKNIKDKTYFQEKKHGKLQKINNIKEKVKNAILNSFTIEEFAKKLNQSNLQFYIRGETAGIIDLQDEKKTKYRLKRLELEEEFENLLEYDRVRQKELEEIKKLQERSREIDLER